MTQQTTHLGAPPRKRRGGVLGLILGVLGLVIVLVAGWLVFSGNDGNRSGNVGAGDLYAVARGSFDVTIPASGEFAALRQVEIRNPLETRAVITWIVDEGITVQKDEVLVRFADEDIRNQISERELAVLSAENSLSSARNELSIVRSRNTSNLSQAETDVELAKIAFEQWEKGTLESRRKELDLSLATAERNFERLKERMAASEELYRQDFISNDEYRRDQIALVEAEATVEMAKLNIEVFEKYQVTRDRTERQASVERAVEELGRVIQQNAAELERAESNVIARQGELDNRRQMLAYWKEQLDKAVVRAPAPGLVVYGSSLDAGGRGERTPPEIGSEVRRNDRIIVLPDISQMTADVKVHESVSGRIQRGQRARVTSDTHPGRSLSGSVMSVSVLAETGNWRDPNRRDYTVRVLLDGLGDMEIKPSTRCKAEIYLDRVDDALHVPIQAVFRRAGKTFVYVPKDNGFAQREVAIGRASETRLEILSGVSEHDRVLIREPRESEIVERLQFDEQRVIANGAPPSPDEQPDRTPGGSVGDVPGARQGPNNQRRGGMDPAAMIAQFDTDGDGRLSREEVPEQMQAMFDRADTNEDGYLDEEELRNAFQRAGQGGREPGRPGTGTGPRGGSGE